MTRPAAETVAGRHGDDVSVRLRGDFEAAVAALEAAPGYAKPRYQTQVHRLAGELLDSEAGVRTLLGMAPRLASAGVFHGGPWEHASRLLPGLVGYGLRGEGVYPTIEALSELRMVAIATGAHDEPGIDAAQAERFLHEVCVQNLDLMFPDGSEEARQRPKIHARAERLFGVIRAQVSLAGFGGALVEEVETICAQRPIVTRRVRRLLELAGGLPDEMLARDERRRLEHFWRACGAVTQASVAAGEPGRYSDRLGGMAADELAAEAGQYARSLHATGLASPYHAVLVRHVAQRAPELLAPALGLSALGAACLEEQHELVKCIVDEAIAPGTEVGVLGLAKTLDRALLSRPEIEIGMRRLLRVAIVPSVARRLEALGGGGDGPGARSLLVAGVVSVLGLPLGIGQGHNPTCQAARGLSLWSQHAPGLLLKILVRAVRNGVLHVGFEQHDLLITEEAAADLAAHSDRDLDPVSAVLGPLLNALYSRLLALAAGRASDAHRWVNPAMYGSWVPNGFRAAFDPVSGAVVDHVGFVRLFYATHHPDHNGGSELLYPNPVGIVITDVHGAMLGYHAISVQRVAADPGGRIRVYFFNPNNEGRQRWGHGVAPTVAGNGERPGESSLPFGEFTSRLYAFHFDRYEKGDEARVPAATVAEVSRMAASSWGRSVAWLDPTGRSPA